MPSMPDCSATSRRASGPSRPPPRSSSSTRSVSPRVGVVPGRPPGRSPGVMVAGVGSATLGSCRRSCSSIITSCGLGGSRGIVLGRGQKRERARGDARRGPVPDPRGRPGRTGGRKTGAEPGACVSEMSTRSLASGGESVTPNATPSSAEVASGGRAASKPATSTSCTSFSKPVSRTTTSRACGASRRSDSAVDRAMPARCRTGPITAPTGAPGRAASPMAERKPPTKTTSLSRPAVALRRSASSRSTTTTIRMGPRPAAGCSERGPSS